MAKKRDTGRKNPKLQDTKALSRRGFVTGGAAAGVGAAVLAGAAEAQAQGVVWNYEADIVVLGSGCVGLHAAIRARDLGASVIVIDQNFDVGGKLVHSGGWTSLGGGDAIQERDRAAADPDRLGLTAPLVKPADLEDDPDRLFRDMTDWSVVDATGVARYRYNDRELHRAWADNAPKVRQFMMDNYVRFARIDGTHQGGGVSRARAARAIMKLADKTDIKAGTLSPQDRGDPAGERHSPFNPMRTVPGGAATSLGAPGWVYGGFVIARSLEFSAREKGIRFMLNRHMDELIREQPFSGRVLGVKASYTPRMHPESGARLESFWQNGNIDERAGTITHPCPQGGDHRHGGHAWQHSAAHHDRSPHGRAVDRVWAEFLARTAEHGRQRHHRRHEDRRQSRRHDAELPAFAGFADHLKRHRHPRCGGQHFPRTSGVPVRARQGRVHRLGRLGTCDRGKPGRAALLRREHDRQYFERRQISARHRRHPRSLRAARLAQHQHRAGEGAI